MNLRNVSPNGERTCLASSRREIVQWILINSDFVQTVDLSKEDFNQQTLVYTPTLCSQKCTEITKLLRGFSSKGMKTSAKAQTTRPMALKGFKVPWLMIHDTPHFTPTRAMTRQAKLQSPPVNETPKDAPLPFLQHAHVKFTPDELKELTSSVESARRKGQLYRVPSKLQELKMTRFDSAQNPLAMDLELSTPYLVPTSTKNVDLGRNDSLVSFNGDDDYKFVETPRTTRVAGSGGYSTLPFEDDESTVTIAELKNQVWAHTHRHREESDDGKCARPFTGGFVSTTREAVSPGRQKLLRAIRRTATESRGSEMPSSAPVEVLTERSYCAQRFHEYLRQRRIPQPAFLEKPAGMPEYGYGRWRRHVRSGK